MSRREKILDTEMDICDYEDVRAYVKEYLYSDKCHSVMFLNIYAFALAQKNMAFGGALSRSDLVLNDGVGIEKLARAHGVNITVNMNGTDLIPHIMKWTAEEERAEIFILGGKDGVAEKAAGEIETDFSGVRVCGHHHGYISEEMNDEIIDRINASQAKLLIIGMGMPKQEIWIDNNKERLKDVRIVIAGGAIIDYLSKTVTRCPDIFVRLKLEWLYRMCREPGRLWKRNVSGAYNLIKYGRKKVPKEAGPKGDKTRNDI